MANVVESWDNERWEWVTVEEPDDCEPSGFVVGPLAGAGTLAVNNPHKHIMGVERTETGFQLPDGLTVDWISLTFPCETRDRQWSILSMLGETFPLQSTPYGGSGYVAGASFLAGGRVLWHPDRLEMGVNLRMPAKCLADLVDLLPEWSDPMHILDVFVNVWGASATRFDLALDSEVDLVTLAVDHLGAGNVTTRARGYEVRQPMKITGEMKGYGVTIGSRSSETYVRIYDKALEQGLEAVDWFRAEFEYKGDRAAAVTRLLLAGDFEGLRGLMLGHLDFKSPSASDINKRRWVTASWWSDLLGTLDKRVLELAKKALRTIDQVGEWLQKQCGPSLALWWVHCESEGVNLGEWVMECASRWGPKHKLILQTAA